MIVERSYNHKHSTKTNIKVNQILEDVTEWLSCVQEPCKTKEELIAKAKNVKDWVIEEIDEFIEATENNDTSEQLNAIADAGWIIFNLVQMAGFTPSQIQKEAELVRESNFSKFCKNIKEAEDSVLAYASGTHPNKLGVKIETYVKETRNEEYPYVVLKSSDHKILKSINFKDVADLK